MDPLHSLIFLTIWPALLTAATALIVALVPRWRRATPSAGGPSWCSLPPH